MTVNRQTSAFRPLLRSVDQSYPYIVPTAEPAMMSEDLTKKVLAWAGKVATHAAQLSSRQAREEYLAERRRELVFGARAEGTAARDAAILADACVSAARRIMTELLAQRAGVPRGALRDFARNDPGPG